MPVTQFIFFSIEKNNNRNQHSDVARMPAPKQVRMNKFSTNDASIPFGNETLLTMEIKVEKQQRKRKY